MEIRAFVIGINRTVERLKLHQLWPKLVSCVSHVFAEALNGQYNEEQRAGVSQNTFWRKYRALHKTFGGKTSEAIDELQQARGRDYSLYVETLKYVVQDTLGKSMYMWALPRAMAQHMEKFINSQLVYPEGRLFSKVDKDNIIEACQAEAERIGATEAWLELLSNHQTSEFTSSVFISTV